MSTFVEFDTGPLQAAIEAALFNVAQSQRRDRFAAAALTGLLVERRGWDNVEDVAADAVQIADATIAALDAPKAGT